MSVKDNVQKEPDKAPSPAELARLYLDLWEKNLALCARNGIATPTGTGTEPSKTDE